MSDLRRQDAPPKPGPDILVIRCDQKVGIRCQIVSDGVWGCWTHWDGRRSRECTGEDNSCTGHANQWPTRWKGYLYVWSPAHKAFCFLEITPAAASEIARQQGDAPYLRGWFLRLDRQGASIRCKIVVELSNPNLDTSALPKPLNPEPVLRKLWGWREGS